MDILKLKNMIIPVLAFRKSDVCPEYTSYIDTNKFYLYFNNTDSVSSVSLSLKIDSNLIHVLTLSITDYFPVGIESEFYGISTNTDTDVQLVSGCADVKKMCNKIYFFKNGSYKISSNYIDTEEQFFQESLITDFNNINYSFIKKCNDINTQIRYIIGSNKHIELIYNRVHIKKVLNRSDFYTKQIWGMYNSFMMRN